MSDKEIVDRLKAEGDLIRNRGKNSIKAVLVHMDKFNDLFMSIDRNLSEQTAILRSNLGLQTEEIERQRREESLREVSNPAPTPRPPSNSRADTQETDKSFFGGLAGLIAGRLTGMNMAGLTGIVAKGLYAGFVGFLAPAIGTWMGDFVEQSLKNLNVNDLIASAGGDAIGSATTMGLIGSIFSKRIGVLFAAGGFMYSFADDLLVAMGFTEEQMSEALIGSFTTQDVAGGVMFAIGTALSTVLLKKSLWSGLFSMSGTAASAILSKTGLGLLGKVTIPTAVIGAYLMYGDAAKKAIEEMGVPKDIADVVVDVGSYTAMGASIGSMFGPGGTVAGAAIGLALGIGRSWGSRPWCQV